MRFKTINKNKPFYQATTVKNAESSASIPLGTPVIYAFNGTDDGLAVVLPTSSTSLKSSMFFAGVCATPNLAPGAVGDAMVDGFCLNAILSRATRAASTDAWASMVPIALGDQLNIDTVANAFKYVTVGNSGVNPPYAVFADAGQTAASTTTAASNAYTQWAGLTAATLMVKVLLKNM